jgi:non-ribosomal peptide synthetase component E (peptide arylation enzyme)
VLRPLLEQRAAETADGVFARFADGTTWTYRQTRDVARRAALGFQSLGVQHGDTVLSWLPNGPDALRVWFGLNYLGLSGTRALTGGARVSPRANRDKSTRRSSSRANSSIQWRLWARR